MVKHVLVAVASATALLSGGAVHAAQQQCGGGVLCLVSAGTSPCDDLAVVDCHVCVLPESLPVYPCIFET